MNSSSHPIAWRAQDVSRVIILTIASVAQIASVFTPRLFDGATEITAQSAKVDHALVPAGYAFAIWGLIFMGCLALTVWHLLPRNWSSPLARSIGWLAAGMFTVNAIWQLIVPFYGIDWASVLLLAIEPVLGVIVVLRIREQACCLTKVQRLLVAGPLQILTGWTYAASFVGVSSALLWNGGSPIDTRQFVPAAILLVIAIAACARGAWATAALPVALAMSWALVGIVVKASTQYSEPGLAGIAACGVAAVLASWWSARHRTAASPRLQRQASAR